MKNYFINIGRLAVFSVFGGCLCACNNQTKVDCTPEKEMHVYICLGQSNMEGNAPIEPQDTLDVNPRFKVMQSVMCSDRGRVMGQWYVAQPPLVRCHTGLSPADYFGRTLVDSLPDYIDIGIINVSVGGCRIELFEKENFAEYVESSPDWLKNMVNEYDGNPYARLVEMARKAQQTGRIKGILLHQGESNGGDSEWPSRIENVYSSLLTDLDLDRDSVPLLIGELVGEDQNGACSGMNQIIRTLPSMIPNSYVIPSQGCEGVEDRLHFSAAGYRELGRRYALQMLEILNK